MNNTTIPQNKFGVTGANDPTECLRGNGYTDPAGVFHCPSNEPPTCPAGQHVIGNYVGELICAPNTCPAGTHMGWNTAGTRVICAQDETCPAGYHMIASGNCVRDIPVAVNPVISTENGLINYAKNNPLLVGVILLGGYYLLKKK